MDCGFFPERRMRRNRYHPAMRRLLRETVLAANDLIQPLFVKEGLKEPRPIETMPGQSQHTVESCLQKIKEAEEIGLPAVIIFGIPAEKDERGSAADSSNGIVQRVLKRAAAETEDILLIADLCLCQYTVHGHCGILKDGVVDNDLTLRRLADIAISLAGAGADVIAPSDMMDGRIGAIRTALDENGYEKISILSYAVKYHSAFYGPFRDAAESAPQSGDRSSYQMDPANSSEALEEARLDLQEGADWLMVKPALPYLDIIRRLRDSFSAPLAAYCVSGEYAMIEAAAAGGYLEREKAIMETLTAIKRAGADAIITYWASEIARNIR